VSARTTALPCTAALLILTHVALVVYSAAANKVGHVMLLGDNFYGSGIHGDDTSCRFKKTFEDVYSAASLKDIMVGTFLRRLHTRPTRRDGNTPTGSTLSTRASLTLPPARPSLWTSS
jgi:hypothetical protein